MKRRIITPDLQQFPEEFHSLLLSGRVYDSSCSEEARVYYLDCQDGLFLKSAPGGSLRTEAEITRWYHSQGLSAEVLCYLPGEQDWLLTRQIPGEDCTHSQYLEDPKRLCDTIATLLRQLHETCPTGCPVPNRNESWFQSAQDGYARGVWEPELFETVWAFSSLEEVWHLAQSIRPHLKNDTLLHGDYCLPNILLNDWAFSGFIDVGRGGIGDRHIDLCWGTWTLTFNLKTTAYFHRFLDVYGRDKVDMELLRCVAAAETLG